MTLGIRGKLFFTTVGLVLPAMIVSALYLDYTVRDALAKRLEMSLAHDARTVGAVLARDGILEGDVLAERAAIDDLTDALGVATDSRLTVIAADGSVLGDTDVDTTALTALDDHSSRPEVQAVRQGADVGVSRRYSDTVGNDRLYVALPVEGAEGVVVRVSIPLTEEVLIERRLRGIVLLGILLGLFVALVMSGVASHAISRTMVRMVDTARSMATRSSRSRIDVASRDELGSLAGSMNQLAEDLESVVSTLAEERDRFGTVLESMGEAVLAINPDRTVRLVNTAATEMLGLTRSPIGRPFTEVIRAPEVHDLVALALEYEADTARLETEVELVGPPSRVLNAYASRVGATGGLVLVLHDITELRQLESLRRDFVANVSHELRTPVSVIRATAETLADGALEAGPEIAGGFVDAIVRNAERLTRLVTDLLDISRIESGNYRTEIEDVAVHRAVVDAIDASGVDVEHRPISVLCDTQVHVMADAFALEHVLINLLENADKYTPEGARIEIRVLAEADDVTVEVADDGPGIEARHRARIFERFYRVDAGRSREKGGTGLGLSIVKNLITSMNGEVGVRENEPRGSVFWFRLPRSMRESEEAA